MSEKEEQAETFNYVRLKLLISSVGMRTLRLLFRCRYKALTGIDWENGSKTSTESFIKREVSTLELTSDQRQVLKTADISKWDFTLLVKILLGMGHRNRSNPNEMETKPAEDKAVKELRDIRNYVEHVAGYAIPNVEYEEKWGKAKSALLRLGGRGDDIEHYRTSGKLEGLEFKTTAVDKENESRSKALRGQGQELIIAGDFDGGIQLFSKALLLSGLSNEEKTCLYSSRSQAYISRLEDPINDSLPTDVLQNYKDVAMEDAKLVIQLKPKWWEGHFLEGKCFQVQQLLREAIDSLETALSYYPDSDEATNALAECRLDQWDIDYNVNYDPIFSPRERTELVHTEDERCYNQAGPRRRSRSEVKEIQQMKKSRSAALRASGLVFKGQSFIVGVRVPLDKKKGTELFRKAAKSGSADGIYNLGLSYLRGVGVRRSIPKGVKLLEVAANKPHKTGLEFVYANESIARARGMMGILYHIGVGKVKNYEVASAWFTRAMLEGFCIATTNLAGMHLRGMGFPRNLKRAVQYERLGVEQGSGAVGMYYLGLLYYKIGDLTLARYWHDRAIDSGYTIANLKRDEFEKQLQHSQCAFEELSKKLPSHVLEAKVSIHILYDRYVKRLSPELSEIRKICSDVQDIHPTSDVGEGTPGIKRVWQLPEMLVHALSGQEYARILLEALSNLNLGVKLIRWLLAPDRVEPYSDFTCKKIKKLALAKFAACYTAEVGYIVSLPSRYQEKLMEIAMEFICDEERSDADFHARVCRLNLSMNFYTETLKFAKVCTTLYSEQPHFHIVHADMLGFLGRHEEGVKVAEEGLKLFPDNCELLYVRAGHLRLFSDKAKSSSSPSPSEFSEAQAYQEFIKKAPSGHRKVPEAYYRIAIVYALKGDLEEFETYYLLGLKAENKLLSTFLPYDSNTSKKVAQLVRRYIREVKDKSKYLMRLQNVLNHLLEEDKEEIQENLSLKLTSPKRTVAVRLCRSRFAEWEAAKTCWEVRKGLMNFFARTAEGKNKQRAPSRQEIPSLIAIRFEGMDPTIDQVYKGRLINLTIMKEYIDSSVIMGCIHSVVKDDNEDFNVICFYNLDRHDPSTSKKLGFGYRIQLMNPYMNMRRHQFGGPVIRVDDPKSVLLVSNGEENPICRYCWRPNPGSHCSKCKTAQYCNKDCQKLDWEDLGHKDLCKVLCNRRKTSRQ